MGQKTKTIVATESHRRKSWTITLTGTGEESRSAAVKALSVLEVKGFRIVSGSSPFADPKKKRPRKAKATEQPLLQALPL